MAIQKRKKKIQRSEEPKKRKRQEKKISEKPLFSPECMYLSRTANSTFMYLLCLFARLQALENRKVTMKQ